MYVKFLAVVCLRAGHCCKQTENPTLEPTLDKPFIHDRKYTVVHYHIFHYFVGSVCSFEEIELLFALIWWFVGLHVFPFGEKGK